MVAKNVGEVSEGKGGKFPRNFWSYFNSISLFLVLFCSLFQPHYILLGGERKCSEGVQNILGVHTHSQKIHLWFSDYDFTKTFLKMTTF